MGKGPCFTTGNLVLVIIVCVLGAAPAVASEYFTLDRVVAVTLQNNGELKALREETGVREAGKIKAGLFPNPVLELDGATGGISGSPSENRLSIAISQEFMTMGKRGKRLQIAEKEIESYHRQVDDTARLLTEEVTTVYYDLLLAQMRVRLAERSVELNEQLLNVTKERLAAGDIPELEVNLARVEVARSEGKKIDAERELYPARERLFAHMGLATEESASFAGFPEGRAITKSREELKALALATRPDLRALEAEKAKNGAAITLAQAEAIPNITAGLGYQRENSVVEVGGEEGKTRDNLISLKLSIPLPVFDRNQAAVSEARARNASGETRYLFTRRTIEREVDAAYARLTTAERSLALYAKEIIPQLEENLKLVQEAYRLGEVGILTVIEEQKKFFEVHAGYLSAMHACQTALARLSAAVGADVSKESSGGGK